MFVRYSTMTDRGDCRQFVPRSFCECVRHVRAGIADGMTVDLIDSPGNYVVSYEVVPGCKPYAWYGTDTYAG